MSSFQHITNVPYRVHSHGGWTIQGYSRALVHSCWRIPELEIGFDLGAIPWEFLATPRWFISHGHIDHLAALPILVSRRNIMAFPEATVIYVPGSIVDDVQEMLTTWEKLDRGSQTCNIVGLAPGDEVAISGKHVLSTFATTHTVDSLGFIIWERRQKLKEEFAGLSGDQIRDLRQSKTEVTQEVRVPILCYTGDTSPAGMDSCPAVFEAKILITEMTVLKPTESRERIHSFGHMHIDDFVERADLFHNELVIAGHISSRYTVAEAEQYLRDALPEGLRKKVHLWT